MKDWILVIFLVPLAAIALGLFGLIGLQGVVWDRAYDHALSRYQEAYAHRDDPDPSNTFPSLQQYDEAEKRLESIQTTDPDRIKKLSDLRACGLSLKGYHDLRANGFGSKPFEKSAAACIQ
jgi:hypothetical protein